MDATDVNFVRDLFLRRKKTHAEISNILKQKYPGEKGFSERTVRRFCLNNNIVRNRITTDELEGHVRTAVKQVSPGTCNIFPIVLKKDFDSQLFRYTYFIITGWTNLGP